MGEDTRPFAALRGGVGGGCFFGGGTPAKAPGAMTGLWGSGSWPTRLNRGKWWGLVSGGRFVLVLGGDDDGGGWDDGGSFWLLLVGGDFHDFA